MLETGLKTAFQTAPCDNFPKKIFRKIFKIKNQDQPCGTIVEQMIIIDEEILDYTCHYRKDCDGRIMKFCRFKADEESASYFKYAKDVEDLQVADKYLLYEN